MPEIDQLAMSIDEAARRAGLGRDKIYTAVKEGKLEARKAGRRTLVTADALRRFIDNLPTLQLT
jgi:excisionase family DNA binding protein